MKCLRVKEPWATGAVYGLIEVVNWPRKLRAGRYLLAAQRNPQLEKLLTPSEEAGGEGWWALRELIGHFQTESGWIVGAVEIGSADDPAGLDLVGIQPGARVHPVRRAWVLDQTVWTPPAFRQGVLEVSDADAALNLQNAMPAHQALAELKRRPKPANPDDVPFRGRILDV